MTTFIAFIICAALFVCAIVLLRHMFVKSASGETFVVSRISMGACLAACFAVIALFPLL